MSSDSRCASPRASRGMSYVGICDGVRRRGNRTKTWSERKFTTKNAKCEDSELRLEKIPCEFGVDCAEMHKFDIMEDTGINVAGRNLKDKMSRISTALVPPALRDDK